MIVGDFNAHNPVWESDKVTDKDKVVKDVLSNLNLCILKDGSNTYLHPGLLLLLLHWLNKRWLFFTLRFPFDCTWRITWKWLFPYQCWREWYRKNRLYRKLETLKGRLTLFESLCLKNISGREFECKSDPIQKLTESLFSFANKCTRYFSSKRIKKTAMVYYR